MLGGKSGAVAVAILVSTAFGSLLGVSAVEAAAPCPMAFAPAEYDRYITPGVAGIAIEFNVVETAALRFYYGVAFAVNEASFPDPPTREGAIVARLLEDSSGNILDYGATRVFSDGVSASIGGMTLHPAGDDTNFCSWIASGGQLQLEPGLYRLVVPGATAFGSEVGALVPTAVDVVSVATVETIRLDPDSMGCVGGRAVTPLVRPTLLAGCGRSFDITGASRAYWAFHSLANDPADPTRRAEWTAAGAGPRVLSGFDVGAGGSGAYSLDVPVWLAPAGHTATSGPVAALPPDDAFVGVVAVVR